MRISAPERMTRTPTLSRASPRNPFRSPGPSHAGLRRAGDGTAEIPHDPPGAFSEITTPLQLAAMIGHGSVVEFDGVGDVAADANARAVRLPFALVAALELDFRVEILTLGVRGQKVVQPSRNVVVASAGKRHRARSLAPPTVPNSYPPRERMTGVRARASARAVRC